MIKSVFYLEIISKINEVKIRLKNDYVDNVLQHAWLIDNYIAKFGFVDEILPVAVTV